MNNNLSYERKTAEETFEWLKLKASELSEGRWTDFSTGDIGSVLLSLVAYLSDINNFQIDKTASELFLDTAVERSSIMSILKLIGYQPRHYESSYTDIMLKTSEDINNMVIPKYSTFTNNQGSIVYTLMDNIFIYRGQGVGVAYEGKRVVTNFQYDQIQEDGKIYLQDYKLGMNTVELFISGVPSDENGVRRVSDVRYSEGEFTFSVHVNEYGQVYLQLPSYWTDLVTRQSSISVSYLLTSGEAGRIGANILTKPSSQLSLSSTYVITNPEKSKGGYFPETADELKLSAPKMARTMLTVVTKKDVKDLVSALPMIADLKAGDYNDEWTNLVQPSKEDSGRVNDAYKCKILVVPLNVNETSIFEDVYEYLFKKEIHSGETYAGSDGTIIEYSTDLETLPDIYKVERTSSSLKIYEYSLVKENQLTSTAKEMVDLIDSRRVASISISYEDPKRKLPELVVKLYTEPDDLRKLTLGSGVVEFIKQVYDRKYCTIGRSIPYSVMGRDIHLAFPEVNYVELVGDGTKIDVSQDEFIDMYYAKFKIYVNDELIIDEL